MPKNGGLVYLSVMPLFFNKVFSSLVKKCKKYGRAMRIGTKHGSLSDCIMSYYGDSTLGMELLSPLIEVGKWLLSLAYWEDSLKSSMFCMVSSYIIFRGWLGYAFAFMLICMALFMVLTRFFGQGSVEELNVVVPPSMNTMEQLLAVQNAISQTEELIQDGNIVLLKFRALLLSIFPQTPELLYKSLAPKLVVGMPLKISSCIQLLVGLTVRYPQRSTILRGNHVSRQVCGLKDKLMVCDFLLEM